EAELSPTDFQKLILDSIDLFCIAGMDGYLRWVSPGFTRALGWSSEELYATPFIKFIHPDDVEGTVAEIQQLENGFSTQLFENRCKTKSGEWAWLQWNARPDPSGLIYCTVREVTRQIELERLSENRARYLLMAEELAQVGHWHANLKLEKLTWSDEVFKIHGLPRGEEPNLADAINFYHPDDREKVNRHLQEAIASRRGFSFELRLVRIDGAVRIVESRGRTEVDDEGVVVGLFGVFMDVTDRVEQQRELERRKQKLQQFVHVASHDLQEPLRMVSSYIQILNDRYAEAFDERGLRFMNYVTEGATRMKTLLDDVLAFSRSNGRALKLQPVDVASTVAA
ncbi:MAG: PAS domain-containing protein, partial [Myxococcota bacterium]